MTYKIYNLLIIKILTLRRHSCSQSGMHTNTLAMNILLADDNQGDCLLFKDALDEIDIKTSLTVSNNGKQMMKALDGSHPDVIFLDINMPCKNGYECLEDIKNNPVLTDIPVVVMSTSNSPESISMAFQKGATTYICKPDSFAKLVLKLEQVLSGIRRACNEQIFPQRNIFLLAI